MCVCVCDSVEFSIRNLTICKKKKETKLGIAHLLQINKDMFYQQPFLH